MESTFSRIREDSGSKFVGAVFLYVFVALLITAGVSAIVGFGFKGFFEANPQYYYYLLIGCAIAYLPLILWIQLGAFRGRGSIVVPFVLYTILMGLFGSSLAMVVPLELISISFAITALTFGSMFLIGWFSKKNLSTLALVAFGLLIGLMLMSLFNVIWMWLFPAFYSFTYFGVSCGMFVVMLLITIYDVWRIKRIAANGYVDNNLALYCAFNLYVDFIYIFIRVLFFVSRIFGRR